MMAPIIPVYCPACGEIVLMNLQGTEAVPESEIVWFVYVGDLKPKPGFTIKQVMRDACDY
jgi:hypothetical protein